MAPPTRPLVLHAHDGGPNPFKPAILLEALGIPYTVKIWDFSDSNGGVKGPIFLKINENGRVPALEDPNTGVVSWESGAVINYILRAYDVTHKYYPNLTAHEQAHVDYDKWTMFLLTTLAPMTGQLNWYRHYNATSNPDALARYEAQTYRCYDVFEGQLGRSGGASVLETGYSAVDMHFYPWIYQYKFAGLSLDKHPLIAKWLAGMGEKAEVKAAYKAIGEGVKA